MKHTKWYILLALASAMLVCDAVRDIRRPAASVGAERTETGHHAVHPDAGAANARFRPSPPDPQPNETAAELQQQRLETAQDAESVRLEEAATELQHRQQQITPPQPEIPTDDPEEAALAQELHQAP